MLAMTFVWDFFVFIFPVTASFTTVRSVLPFRQAGGPLGGQGRFGKTVYIFRLYGKKC